MDVAREHPGISLLQRSIVCTAVDNGNFGGNGVIIDRKILACSAHQVHGQNQMAISFPRQPDMEIVQSTASFIAQDPATDLSFWRFDDPETVANCGMQPITWGAMWDGRRRPGDSILEVSYLPIIDRNVCDAKLHKIIGYYSTVNVYDDQGQVRDDLCKFDLDRPIVIGKSGSGAFDPGTGQFLGLFNAAGTHDSMITPSEAIWQAYIQIQPNPQLQDGSSLLPCPPDVCIPNLTSALVPGS